MKTPAQHVIEKCGGGSFTEGVKVVAEITGADKTRVHRWTYPKSRGGTDGVIPSQHQQVILDAAKARGVGLTPDDFFEAASEAA